MARPDPNKARVTVMRARQLLREKRYADALQVCADELARGSDDAGLRLVAAHSLLAQGRHEGAKKEAQQVLRVDPAVAEAHRILADVACARGELATACDHLERILTLEPGDRSARQLLETLSRSSHAGGDETVPMPGAMQLSDRAASLERFIEDEGRPQTSTSFDTDDGPDLDDAFVEISDSMMEELPGPEPKPRDAGADWLPAGASAKPAEAPLSMGGFDALPPDANEEDAPTMPLLRPSAPKEPELKLDPRAKRPVQQDQARRPLQEPDLAPEPGPSTQPISPSQLIMEEEDPGFVQDDGFGHDDGFVAQDDGFEDFGVEPASVPVSRSGQREIRKSRDPVQARKELERRPPRGGDDAGEGAGDLMSMLTGGPDTGAQDNRGAFAAQDNDSGAFVAQDNDSGAFVAQDDDSGGFVAQDDDAFVAKGPGSKDASDAFVAHDDSGAFVAQDDDAFVAKGKVSDDSDAFMASGDDAWDPMGEIADGGPSRSRRRRSGDDLDDSLAAAGLAPPPKKKGRFKLFLVLFLLAGMGAGGGYGYYWYRTNQFVEAEWKKLRTALHLATPAGYEAAKEAAVRILDKRPQNAGAVAALGMIDAAKSIELGQDRRAQAKKALDKTKGKDSEWRTAAQGFLALIDDPPSAVGYLQKGSEVFPKSALLLYLRGRALVASGKDQKGADTYQEALKLAPTFVAARIALAALVGQQDKGYGQAAQMFDKVLKGHPGHIQALVERARLRARHKKELEGAIADMKRIGKDLASKAGRGQKGWAQLVLAKLYLQRGKIKEMSAALDAAIASPPCCNARYRHELAGELMGLFRLRDAYQQQLAALSLNKRSPPFLQRAGRLLLAMGRPEKAAKYISQAPAGLAETKVLSARLKFARRRYEDAEGAFKPLLGEAKVGTEAKLYHALTLAKLGKSKEALAALAALAKAQPQLETAPQFAGLVELWGRRLKRAEAQLKKAWKINSLDPRTPLLLGHVSLGRHDIDNAVRRYERALKSRKDYAPAHIALGHLLWQIGNLPSANARLGKVAEADRGLVSYRTLAARVAMAEKRFEAAQNAITQLKAANPPKTLVARLEGELALAQGKGKQALALLSAVRKKSARDGELVVLVGQAQLTSRKLDDAYDTLLSALKLDDGHPVALLELGRIAIRDAEYPLAVKRLKEALEAMKKRRLPKYRWAAVFAALGHAFLAQRDTGRAMTNLQDAIDHNPKSAEPQYRMGVTYDTLDRPQRAVAYYQKAIANDASYAAAYKRLGMTYVKLNENAKAIAQLQKYLEVAPKARDAGTIKRKIRKLKKAG